MESGLLLDVVVRESTSILKLLSSENQTLLIWRDSLLVLDLALDVVDGVGGLNLKSDGLAGDCMKMLADLENRGGVVLRRQIRRTYESSRRFA